MVRLRTLSWPIALLLLTLIALATAEPERYLYTRSSSLDALGIRQDSSSETATGGAESKKRAKQPEYVAHPAGDLVCRPFGECSPCPKDELDQAFCFPFGNRRLLHCLPSNSSSASASDGGQQGEVPAWEACGKVVKKERQDFYEFVTTNVLFLVFALVILWGRTSALAAQQYRQLAARIGIPAGGWVGGG
ncbi:hypothetical protein L202_03597 [Cryptococcus amylolentus CBS 6039]|uniref:Uncharacterized protein n=2 Tax=Cryptococcus amylolentus TaxID=104669 RepID=A0A1E3HTH9_9TREE|nr:hypothetical protein L202_03597 [Cryptococcus amylolentus CBS 6039]ODN79659.1 hypothetical protein L202_03597 [Cryptococcus amylolentus CBS 6039]ODO07972.1 hypothetical protein I350_03555 [Cryptococcus amylolentus CBS 6273]